VNEVFVNLYESLSGHIIARGPVYPTRVDAENDVFPSEKTLYVGTFSILVKDGLLKKTKSKLMTLIRHK
jgi:hypothetical protein